MNPIAKRTVSALATAAAVVGLFLYLPLVALAPVLMVISALVQLEFYQMARAYEPVPRFGILLGFLWLALTAVTPGPGLFPLAAAYGAMGLAVSLFLFGAYVMLRSSFTRPIATLASTFFGFLYVPFLLSFFLRFAQIGVAGVGAEGAFAFAMPASRVGLYTLFAILAVTKLSDMGGFAFGVAFGRHKMIPAVSPKKSWEGFVGSVVGSCLIATLFCWLAAKNGWGGQCALWRHVTYPVALAFGVCVAVAGTLGDLIESRLKRECGVKDSATFMPAGMGGFLDMFDSVLFMPALVYPFVLWSALR